MSPEVGYGHRHLRGHDWATGPSQLGTKRILLNLREIPFFIVAPRVHTNEAWEHGCFCVITASSMLARSGGLRSRSLR